MKTVMVAVILTGLVLAGCASDEVLVATARSPISDVPIPQKLKYADKESYSREEGGRREYSHVYRGNASKRSVALFFKDHLPRHGWKFVSDSELRGLRMLEFTKGKERLTLQMFEEWGSANLQLRLREY